MRMLAALIVLAALAPAAFSADQASDKVEYRFRFQPGEKYSLITTVEQKVAQVVQGREQIVEQTTRGLADFDVQDIDPDGSAWVKYTYKQVAMRATTPAGSFEFDSTQSQTKVPPQALPIVLVLGESLFLRVTPQGRIDKINGLTGFVSSTKGKLPAMPGRDQILQAIDSQYSETALRRSLEGYLAVFPDPGKKVAVGDTWSRTVREPGDDFAVQKTWRLKEKGAVDVIEVNLVIKPSPDAAATQFGSVAVKREVTGQGQGLIRIDSSTGLIIKSTVKQNITEQAKAIATGSLRRVQDPTEPVKRGMLTTVEMTVRQSDANEISGRIPPRLAPAPNEPNVIRR